MTTLSSPNQDVPADAKIDGTVGVVKDLLSAHRAYHHHKETMAYAAFSLYFLIFGAALVTTNWPPPWSETDPHMRLRLTVAAITVVWLMFLLFLKWQLRARRWAALRAAAEESLLASWIWKRPGDEDLARWKEESPASDERPQEGRIHGWVKTALLMAVDYVWPIHAASLKRADVSDTAYPRVVVQAWREKRTTGAIIHERLVVLAGWMLYFALVLRTIT